MMSAPPSTEPTHYQEALFLEREYTRLLRGRSKEERRKKHLYSLHSYLITENDEVIGRAELTGQQAYEMNSEYRRQFALDVSDGAPAKLRFLKKVQSTRSPLQSDGA